MRGKCALPTDSQLHSVNSRFIDSRFPDPILASPSTATKFGWSYENVTIGGSQGQTDLTAGRCGGGGLELLGLPYDSLRNRDKWVFWGVRVTKLITRSNPVRSPVLCGHVVTAPFHRLTWSNLLGTHTMLAQLSRVPASENSCQCSSVWAQLSVLQRLSTALSVLASEHSCQYSSAWAQLSVF